MIITWLDIFEHITTMNVLVSIILAYLTNSIFHKYKVFINDSKNESSIWNVKKIIKKLPYEGKFLYRNGHKIMSILSYLIAYIIFISSINVLELNQQINQKLIENQKKLETSNQQQKDYINKIKNIYEGLRITQSTYESFRISLIDSPRTTITKRQRQRYTVAVNNLNKKILKLEGPECQKAYKIMIMQDNNYNKANYLKDIILKIEDKCSILNLKYAYLLGKLKIDNHNTERAKKLLYKAENINKKFNILHPQILHEIAIINLKEEKFKIALEYLIKVKKSVSNLNNLNSSVTFRHPEVDYHINLIKKLKEIKKASKMLKEISIII
jgi:hypothetical protein